MKVRTILRPFLYALALDCILVLAVALERFKLAPWMWGEPPDDPGVAVAGPVSSAILLPLLLLSGIFPNIIDSPVTIIIGYTVLFTVLFAIFFRLKNGRESTPSRKNGPGG